MSVGSRRPPSIGAKNQYAIETAFFLRYCPLIGTDRVLLMVMNTLAYADVSADEASSASTIASTVQPPSRGDVFAVAPVSA